MIRNVHSFVFSFSLLALFQMWPLGFFEKKFILSYTHTHTPFLWPLRVFTKDELGAELRSLQIKAHRTYLGVGGACFKAFFWEPPAIDTTQKERISLEQQQYLQRITVGSVRLSIVSSIQILLAPTSTKAVETAKFHFFGLTKNQISKWGSWTFPKLPILRMSFGKGGRQEAPVRVSFGGENNFPVHREVWDYKTAGYRMVVLWTWSAR